MSRIFNRPMFKRGGSAGQGITSGLDRPRKRYSLGSIDWDEVTAGRDKLKESYGRPPAGYGVYDFLTDWGLRMASATPKGNVLQTAASEAIEPHEKLMEGKGKREMADYIAGVSATDKSLSAVAEVAAAQAKANEFNKDYKIGRRINDKAAKIASAAASNPASPGAMYAGFNSFGLAQGEVFIEDLIQKTDGPVKAGVIKNFTLDPKSKEWNFDASKLSGDLVWWDPEEKQWATIENAGKPNAKPVYHDSVDIAFKVLEGTITDTGYDLSQTTTIDLEEQEKGSTIDLKKQIEEREKEKKLEERKEVAEELTWEGYFTKLKLDQEEKLRKQKENEELLASASNALYEQ